jgi:hypothetical protein
MIIITDETYVYSIPEPTELYANMNKYEALSISYSEKDDPSKTIKQSDKIFFTYHPTIFKEYFAKMVEDGYIPDNFYMYVESIINFIKQNCSKDSIPTYWSNMIK